MGDALVFMGEDGAALVPLGIGVPQAVQNAAPA